MRRTILCTWLLVYTALSNGQEPVLGDPEAGYVLDLPSPDLWVSQISYSPGITSKLCIERTDPALLMCIQSLHKPVQIVDRESLAQGFFDSIQKQYGIAPTKSSNLQKFGVLDGFSKQALAQSELLPEDKRQLLLFAGTNAKLEPQFAIAFADPTNREAAQKIFTDVLASVIYQARRSH